MIIYCDGGSRGNPGNAASAFVVMNDEKVVFKEGQYLGIQTNNYAEYTAVLLAIIWLTKQLRNNKEERIIINLDSQLVERQMNGIYKIKSEKLKVIFNQIKFLILNYSLLIDFVWNYRTDNELADELVNEILNSIAK